MRKLSYLEQVLHENRIFLPGWLEQGEGVGSDSWGVPLTENAYKKIKITSKMFILKNKFKYKFDINFKSRGYMIDVKSIMVLYICVTIQD